MKNVQIEENATIYDDIWKLSLIISEGNKIYMWTKTSSNLKMALFFHTSAITPVDLLSFSKKANDSSGQETIFTEKQIFL